MSYTYIIPYHKLTQLCSLSLDIQGISKDEPGLTEVEVKQLIKEEHEAGGFVTEVEVEGLTTEKEVEEIVKEMEKTATPEDFSVEFVSGKFFKFCVLIRICWYVQRRSKLCSQNFSNSLQNSQR